MQSKLVYVIEGLDHLGKSTLIEGIKQKLGYFQTIHFSKPELLSVYRGAVHSENLSDKASMQLAYQQESFRNSMIMVNSGARLIYDRWHLGENVYAPMYRGYSGSYVFKYEKMHRLDLNSNIRLILLTENFEKSKHFKDDGESFDITKRREEQEMFIKAFDYSIISDKKIICVTADSGDFRPKDEILNDALN